MSSVWHVVSAGSSISQLKEEVQSLRHLLSHDEWKELFGKHKFGTVDIPPEKDWQLRQILTCHATKSVYWKGKIELD